MSEADRLYGTGRKKHDPMMLYMFATSLGLLAAYAGGYGLLGLLFGGSDTGSLLAVWLPPFLMGTVVSAIACIPMKFMKKKRIIPGGMVFLAMYYVVLVVAFLTTGAAADPALDIYITSLYALPCIIPGNVLSWLAYRKLYDGGEEDESYTD